jgi:hypothetical protein
VDPVRPVPRLQCPRLVGLIRTIHNDVPCNAVTRPIHLYKSDDISNDPLDSSLPRLIRFHTPQLTPPEDTLLIPRLSHPQPVSQDAENHGDDVLGDDDGFVTSRDGDPNANEKGELGAGSGGEHAAFEERVVAQGGEDVGNEVGEVGMDRGKGGEEEGSGGEERAGDE